MKTKNNLIKLAAGLLCLLVLVSMAAAQKRRTPTRKATKPVATTPTTTTTNAFEIREGAEKVSIQIKNVSKFIYVLGGVARGIEDIDAEAKSGKVSRAGLDKNTQLKQGVMTSIRNLRAGLAALEVEFRTKPALRNYLTQIQGISDISGVAEDQANGGQFTESGKTLLQVIEKLSDTLVAMR
jgi:hypothetical protein